MKAKQEINETPEFLSETEVARLTGWSHPKKQAQHLRSIGIPFFPNARGRPIVPRATLYGGKTTKPKPDKPAWQPAILNT